MKDFLSRYRYVFLTLGLVLGCGCIVASGLLLFSSRAAVFPWGAESTSTLGQTSSNITPSSSSAFSSSLITVEIQGAVVKPGVYQVPADTRVVTLIQQAGGFTKRADGDWVQRQLNQTQVLKDGDKIYIEVQGEVKTTQTASPKKTPVKKKVSKN